MIGWDKALNAAYLLTMKIQEMDRVRWRMLHRILITEKPPGIGGSNARVLMVGDRPTEENVYQLPFVHPKGCAPWLTKQLDDNGFQEEDFYWINAYDVKGKRTDFSGLGFYELGICLGHHASERGSELKRANVCDTIRTLAHPQYWKRFHTREEYPLIDILKGYL